MNNLGLPIHFLSKKVLRTSNLFEHYKIVIIIGLLIIPVTFGSFSNSIKLQSIQIGYDNIIQSNQSEMINDISNMKGWFTENQGQIMNPDVKFVYGASDLSIGFIESGYLIKSTNDNNLTSVLEVTFENSNLVEPEGRRVLTHKSNYFIGNIRSEWRTGVSNFKEINFNNLYEGINLVFYTNEDGLKYDFIIAPGGNPTQISWSYENSATTYVDSDGRLRISTASGSFVEEAPFSYQWSNEKKINVPSRYICNQNTVNLEVGKYDVHKPLIIDPLIFSTFIGGSGREWGEDIAIDSNEDIYILLEVQNRLISPRHQVVIPQIVMGMDFTGVIFM